MAPRLATSAFLLFTLFLLSPDTSLSIGINYGTLGNNLPPPSQVAAFIRDHTFIDRVKIFDSNPDILRAFSNTGISVVITVPDGDIPSLTKARAARHWVANNVAPFYPSTNISLILIGNEILNTGDAGLMAQLVPAMHVLHSALSRAGFNRISVSTPQSMGILAASEPPSAGRFIAGYDRTVFIPMLKFCRDTGSPFVVNAYPYFGYNGITVGYALGKRNRGVFDPVTRIRYTNMFVAMMDAVYSAMRRVGYGDVKILVGETGWPSQAEPGQIGVSVADAARYNGHLIRVINSGRGTPLMPGRRIETYVFSLFNENLKPGPIAERNFGLFNADLTPVYDVGIMRGQSGLPRPTPTPATGKKWCVSKAGAAEAALQSNINYACSTGGVDCRPIQAGGPCFGPSTIQKHADYVMNAYYQASARQDFNCDFAGTGVLTTVDPSYGGCRYS